MAEEIINDGEVIEEEPIVYIHHVRIVEFQAWNNKSTGQIQPYLIVYGNPIVTDNEMEIESKFHEKCMYAAISSCDTHTVKALDEEGNVWHGLQATFRHGHEEEP